MTVEAAPPDPLTGWLKPFKMLTSVSDENGVQEYVQCVKCLSRDVTWDFHPTVMSGFGCWDAVVGSLRVTVDMTDEQYEAVLNSEHLCRSCLACSYAWCERTADAQG